MMKLTLIGIVAALTAFVTHQVYNLVYFRYVPQIDIDFWWGVDRGNKINDDKIYPFKIEVVTEEIDDFYRRLNASRGFSPALENTKCQYGLNAEVMEDIVKFAKEKYDMNKRLDFLNSHPQYKTQIQGLNLHFVHVKPKTTNRSTVLPILLLHGWPSSPREYYDFIANMTTEHEERDFVFEMIMPSLPGFGYSDGAAKDGFRCIHAAAIFKQLMIRLGHEKFLVHGGDWGSVIGAQIATLYPDNVLGYHSNFCFSLATNTLIKWALGSLYPSLVVEDRHAHKMFPLINGVLRFYLYESGYLHLFGTKPDTIGHALDNSPIALFAYALEKISVASDRQNILVEDAGFSKLNIESFLDGLLFYYWFPRKATTAARIYTNLQFDGFKESLFNVPVDPKVPCGCVLFENEFIFQTEGHLRDKFTNLLHYTTYDVGGHFAALEVPDLYLDDLIIFVKSIINTIHI